MSDLNSPSQTLKDTWDCSTDTSAQERLDESIDTGLVLDLEDSDLAYCFNGPTLLVALDDYVQEAVAKFGHKKELIEITAAAMRDFMTSYHVGKHGLVVKALLKQAQTEK